MINLKNFLLGIKSPKKLFMLSAVALIITFIPVSINYFDICSEHWIGIMGAIFIMVSIWLYFLFFIVYWAQTDNLLQETYHDLRQYGLVLEEMKLNLEAAKECQKYAEECLNSAEECLKIKDDLHTSVLTLIERVNWELQYSKEMREWMEEAMYIISNIRNQITQITHD